MYTAISILLGLILLFIFYKLITKSLKRLPSDWNIIKTIICGVLGTFLILINPIIINTDFNNIEHTFKPLYKIDPKENGFIIYNINENRYDTIPHGELETYIMNDNL